MRLSLILCCLNEAKVIGTQLDAIAAQEWSEPWELIVSDNGSTDGTQEIVRSFANRIPNLRIVDASDQRGLAHARNVGAKHSAGEYIAYVDADDMIEPGWIAAMGDAVQKHDFVACRVDFHKLNPDWVRRSRNSTQYNGLQSYTYPPFLNHAGGSTIAIKKTIHDAVGGFNEDILVLEDTDYCWRVQLSGTKLYFVPDAIMQVRLRPGVSTMCRQARRWGEYNVLLYKIYRERGMPKIHWSSGIRNWLNIVRRAYSMLLPQKRHGWLWEVNWAIGRLIGSLKHRIYGL